MPRKSRTTPGMVTQVSPRLRIMNGDVNSLRKLRKQGTPKQTKNITTVLLPEFSGKRELADLNVRSGFQLVRQQKQKNRVTAAGQRLQAKFDALCSDVRKADHFDSLGKVSRVERSVPGSFCSCDSSPEVRDDNQAVDTFCCLLHGTKETE